MADNFSWADLFAQAKAVSFDPVPNGEYHISIHSAEAVPSSTGKPMIKFKLNIEEGEFAGRKLIDQWVLSVGNEMALSIFFRKCKCFGVSEQTVTSFPPGQMAPLAQELFGRHAIAVVEQHEYNGEMRNNIKAYKPYKGAMAQSVMGGTPMMQGGGFPNVGMSGGMMPAGVPTMPGVPAAQPVVTAPASVAPVVSQPVQAPVAPPVPPEPEPEQSNEPELPAHVTDPRNLQADLPF